MIKSTVCILLFALFASLLNAQAPIPFNFAILDDNQVSLYSTASRTAILNDVAITGLPAGTELLAFTLRPVGAQVYGLGSDNSLYTLSVNLASRTVVATRNVTITGCTLVSSSEYAIDVNPVADALRVVANTNTNWRINFATGACTVDTVIAYINGSALTTTGVAYTNNVVNPTGGTREYILDGALNAYTIVNSPNDGNASVVTGLTVDVSSSDVSPLDFVRYNGVDYGYALIGDNLYSINADGSNFALVGQYEDGEGLIVFPNGFFPSNTTTTTTGSAATTGATGSGDATTTTSAASAVVASALLVIAFLAMLF